MKRGVLFACCVAVSLAAHVALAALLPEDDGGASGRAAPAVEARSGTGFADMATGLPIAAPADEVIELASNTPEPVIPEETGREVLDPEAATTLTGVTVQEVAEPRRVADRVVSSARNVTEVAPEPAVDAAPLEPVETLEPVTPNAPVHPIEPVAAEEAATETVTAAAPRIAMAEARTQRDIAPNATLPVRERLYEPRRDHDASANAMERITPPEPAPQRQTAAASGQDRPSAAAAQTTGPSEADRSAQRQAAANYGNEVMRRIQRTRQERAPARGVAVVAFRIAASGQLAAVSIAQSSGNAELDAIALNHIRRAAPFPPPPQGARTSFSVQIGGR